MMPYKSSYWKLLVPLIKGPLKKRFGKEETAELIKKADLCYREMLEKVDDIGAENPMGSNIYMSFVFLSVWKAAEGRITADDLRAIVREALSSCKPIKLMSVFLNANRPGGIKALGNMLKKNAAWLEAHPQYKDVSWDFNFDETKHRDGFYYHFTQCPLNNFARREGMLEVLPVMCETDLLTASFMRAVLHREQTLASGGSVCDYWYVGDQITDPK